MTTVAVAVKGGGGSLGEDGSRWAVQWAAENLMPGANRFILIHVAPPITSVPIPLSCYLSALEVELLLKSWWYMAFQLCFSFSIIALIHILNDSLSTPTSSSSDYDDRSGT